MSIRTATDAELANWDALLATNPLHDEPLQAKVYGEFKSRFGWQPKHLVYEDGSRQIAMLFLVRNLPHFGEIWYCPKGPAISSPAQLKDIMSGLKDELKNAFLVKFEPELMLDKTLLTDLTDLGLAKARFDLQWNKSTIVVDLSPSEDEILQSFKQKHRYNIRLSARKGVVVRPMELTEANMRTMYGLLLETQKRNGFHMRSWNYMSTFWKLYSRAGQGQMFFAYMGDEILSGVFATWLGTRALYKDGGSTRTHSNLMAPYLAQWEVMKWLKGHGVTKYDLHGMPPRNKLEDDSHPLAGLVRFKQGFNAEVTEYVGVYDWPLNASKYARWQKFGERLAVKREVWLRKNLFY
ncbi:peptidoglycan bridge formation glycyltransferase FemA/FemB family protein [Candidatus Saccharibacteria bacterium]|nr:peptidoglycan bridge formation glycyltransferase FemA/FemB family protein [Candidatus Saccharibacteria bacterium]